MSILIVVFVTAIAWFVLLNLMELEDELAFAGAIGAGVVVSLLLTIVLVRSISKPMNMILNIVSYASHNDNREIPNINTLTLGKELVDAQSKAIYKLGESAPQTPITNADSHFAEQMLNAVGIPLIGIDSAQSIVFANESAAKYLDTDRSSLQGSKLFDHLNLSFQGDETMEDWIENSKTNNVTAIRSWQRVKHTVSDEKYRQFDLAAAFSNNSASGIETTLAIFDHTDTYNRDDMEISYVALAVHELRTPLTMMRGYIEVFEDELGPTLDTEMVEFMHRMHASAQQLTAFVGNILNVARVEEDQLALKLRKENIHEIITSAIEDLGLRASVHGKHIEVYIADNLPAVGADRVSVHEIINNLVDNAIKYSDASDKIIIKCGLNDQGMIAISVQDFGIGIPTNVMGQLFQKFHRSHKSRVQIGGTGLGLYLCKALVGAHGGNIWVRSKEGEGSTFTFTLPQYESIKGEQDGSEDGIIRGAHGWIKNHSMYRG